MSLQTNTTLTHTNAQVFAVDNSTKARQKVGYVMLDLRSARVSSQSVSVTSRVDMESLL